MSKLYMGDRRLSPKVLVVENGRRALPHHVRHSPTGFEWGYAGSGPADLARCLLIDALGESAKCPACKGTGRCLHSWIEEAGNSGTGVICETCGESQDAARTDALCLDCWGAGYGPLVERNYQAFKFEIVAAFAKDSWRISQDEIVAWVERREGAAAQRAQEGSI